MEMRIVNLNLQQGSFTACSPIQIQTMQDVLSQWLSFLLHVPPCEKAPVSSSVLLIISSSTPKVTTGYSQPPIHPPSHSPSSAHLEDPPRDRLLGDCVGLEPEHLALLEHKPSAYACMQRVIHDAMGHTLNRKTRHVSMLSLVTW